jgi:hypothetical protein
MRTCTGPKQFNRAWLLETLKAYLAKLSAEERDQMAAELGLTPVINVHFVKGVEGRPEGEIP